MVYVSCSAAVRASAVVVSCRHPACRSELGYQSPVLLSVSEARLVPIPHHGVITGLGRHAAQLATAGINT